MLTTQSFMPILILSKHNPRTVKNVQLIQIIYKQVSPFHSHSPVSSYLVFPVSFPASNNVPSEKIRKSKSRTSKNSRLGKKTRIIPTKSNSDGVVVEAPGRPSGCQSKKIWVSEEDNKHRDSNGVRKVKKRPLPPAVMRPDRIAFWSSRERL